MNVTSIRRSLVSMAVLVTVSLVAVAQPSSANNGAPVFTVGPSAASVVQCQTFGGYTVYSTGGAITSFSISPTPPRGMSFNATTGLLSGRPEIVGMYYFNITGTNAAGSASQWFNLSVTAPTAKGIYPTCQTVSGTVGQPLTTATYTDIDIGVDFPPYNFSITPALPAGLTMDRFTGVISGTPTAPLPQTVFTLQMDEEDTSWTSFVTVTLTIAAQQVAPTTTVVTVPNRTIRCKRGDVVRRVSGPAPRCPKGFTRVRP